MQLQTVFWRNEIKTQQTIESLRRPLKCKKYPLSPWPLLNVTRQFQDVSWHGCFWLVCLGFNCLLEEVGPWVKARLEGNLVSHLVSAQGCVTTVSHPGGSGRKGHGMAPREGVSIAWKWSIILEEMFRTLPRVSQARSPREKSGSDQGKPPRCALPFWAAPWTPWEEFNPALSRSTW